MGFRFKRFDYVGGVAPWTGGDSEQYARSCAVLKDFADFLIACGKGWSLDTAKNATTSDFVDVPQTRYDGSATTYVAPSLFFVNTNGGKLFMCVGGNSTWCGIGLSNDYLLNDISTYPVAHIIYTGIIMSMIPAGSSSNFGNTFDNTFLPTDATLVFGTAQTTSGNTWFAQSYICDNASGVNYSYGLFVDEYCVGIGGGYSASITPTIKPGYFVGRVLGTLANEETSPQAKYGVVKFNDSCNDAVVNAEFKYAVCSRYTNDFNYNFGSNFGEAINTSDTSASTLARSCCGSFVKANGARVDGRNGANIRFYPHTADFLAENTNLSNPSLSSASRWVPFEAGVVSSDLSTDGIVTGDGLKGYLDTNLFRCANVNLNQLYNNGTFIGADSTYHLMIGWDSTNTDSL